VHLKVLALFLSVCSLPALCQSGQAPFIFAEPGKTPPAFTLEPGQDFSSGRREWKLKPFTPFSETILQAPPGPKALRPLGDAQIDPNMILRPPHSAAEAQPQGTLMAQNLFPGLRFLPIESLKATLGPISTVWPKRKMERIPTEWRDGRIIPVYNSEMKQTPVR
jgi:hypothetical protein